MLEGGGQGLGEAHQLTLVVVDVAPVLPQLGELPAALLALALQVLLHAALLAVRGLLHVPPVQGLLVELLPTHVTPARRGEGRQHTQVTNTSVLSIIGDFSLSGFNLFLSSVLPKLLTSRNRKTTALQYYVIIRLLMCSIY